MKNMLKNIKTYVFLSVLLILLLPGQVFADTQYKALDSKQNVACDKIWNVKLNMDVSPDTVTSTNVRVVDDSGNPVNVNLGYISASDSITITPVKNYDQGKTYTIFIENIKSKDGLLLKTPIEMQFTTAASSSSDISQASKLVGVHTYEITDVIKVTGAAGTDFNLTYNMGTPSSSPYQKELDTTVSGDGASIVKTDSGSNQFEAASYIPENRTVEYKVVRTVQNGGIRYIKDLSKTSGDYSNFADYSKYTAPEEKIQSEKNYAKNVNYFVLVKR